MNFLYRRDQLTLFVGDILVFTASLWLALLARHFVLPTAADFVEHLVVFAALFACWLLVFVTVGLYDRHVALFEHRLPATITEAQIVNTIIALLYFFLAPIAIQPKTVLALYFVISTSLIVVWRLGIFRLRGGAAHCEEALLVGAGAEMVEIADEIQRTPRTQFQCVGHISTESMSEAALVERIEHERGTRGGVVVIAESHLVPTLRRSITVEVLDAADLYEALFSRVALGMLEREAFLKAAYSRGGQIYGGLKRAMDVCISLLVGLISLVVYPFVWLAIYAEDGGRLFVSQTRVGQGGVPFGMAKFRTMSGDDGGKYGASGKTTLHVTRVGAFLRKSRVDEVPQLWSVLVGEQSLVGPRPELPPLVEKYLAEIPNYDLRHLVTPGLSGWAQIYHQEHPHHQADVVETRKKLSYDLYYIKHRSLILDLDIALKTIKALALRLGA